MKDPEYIKIIEDLHKKIFEIKDSKEYVLGQKLFDFFTAIKKREVFKFFDKQLVYKKLHKLRSKDIKGTEDIFDYGADYDEESKFVIYTCVVGGYDSVKRPVLSPKNVDYVLFTDDVEKIESEGWIVKPIPEDIAALKDFTLINRYLKFHPSILGQEYRYSIYIDGNIQVTSDLRNLVAVLNNKTGLALHRHSSRNCIYKEVLACKYLKRGKIETLEQQVESYQKDGFPENFGLLEATVILSDLKNNYGNNILDRWWIEFFNSKSNRDQIAFPYVLWKMGYTVDDIGNLGQNVQRNPKFQKYTHK
ncbi:glycosyltransferase domain-containing protein [Sphingobacterium sp. LRF_L2]|uniref:glycosyltransferase domain-containing protein n=1 Tax=Sphingobacterium sp. LRF_L2 TaxID=3369421 RepID=UPI003F637310